jgi:hypothetical protein
MMTYWQRSQKIFQAMLESGATHLSRDILKEGKKGTFFDMLISQPTAIYISFRSVA